MRIQVNGEPRDVAQDLTVSALLGRLGVEPGPVAVERNREIVPVRSAHQPSPSDGDELEVVQFVAQAKARQGAAMSDRLLHRYARAHVALIVGMEDKGPD